MRMSSSIDRSVFRVLLAEDHSVVRDGLKRVLEEADMEVVAVASTGDEALREFKRTLPDVVIMDISMPGMDGLEAVKQLMSLDPETRILVLTMHPEEHYAVRALKAGCLGYVTKSISTRGLLDAVRAVAGGRQFLTAEGKETVALQLLAGRRSTGGAESLSDRELQVLIFLARGMKLKEVASELGLSIRTIETYRLRVLHKLHLRNDADITRFAVQNGLLQG